MQPSHFEDAGRCQASILDASYPDQQCRRLIPVKEKTGTAMLNNRDAGY